MRVLPLDFGQLLWGERGAIALLIMIGTIFWAGYDLTQTPMAALSIWKLAGFGLVGAIALKVSCSASTGSCGGDGGDTSGLGGGADVGGCGGDDGGSC